MTRHRSPALSPGKWYADCRGGDFTSFLKFAGHDIKNTELYFDEMKGFESAYPVIGGLYTFRVDGAEWFESSRTDVEKWGLD